jgi:hypothetical protein
LPADCAAVISGVEAAGVDVLDAVFAGADMLLDCAGAGAMAGAGVGDIVFVLDFVT